LNAQQPAASRSEGESSLVVIGDDEDGDDTAQLARSAAPSELEILRARVQELELAHSLLEDQVQKLHRVKTVMDLLAGVAHDLSSALTGIVWCSEALQRRIAAETDLGAGLADFVSAAEYARTLARRLLTMGKAREGTIFQACSIHSVVADATALVETLRPHTATLQSELLAPDAMVYGNAEQLQQVIVNLTTNAFDAVGGGGGTVRVCVDELPPTASAGPLPWVRIRVSDTGHGMTEDTLRRAFEPFFTTKGARDGNGLGLVVVKNIVQRHRGRLNARSGTGQGTTIEVLLPCSGAPGC
jgi:two-component system, cell cycle sensor histidine kinase and response regulator CckA